jgi:YegS/Rv2252/BmrU family lipid kinase
MGLPLGIYDPREHTGQGFMRWVTFCMMVLVMKQKILLIGNPIAGRGKSSRLIHQCVLELRQRGYRIETFFTRSAGDANRRARCIEPEFSTLIVAGGDGTLNEVLNGLPDPSGIPIALLPTGTANILAHDLALPNRPEAVAQAIEQGGVQWLDMGLVGGHRFLMLVSAGIDAMVTEAVRRRRGQSFGYAGYVLPVLRVLLRYRVPQLRVTVDEQASFRGAFVIVSNTRNYGGIFTFADRARCDSGHFDVCIFPKGTVLGLSTYYLAALRGRVSRRTEVNYLTGRRIRIESKEPVPVQVDGDAFGTTPVCVELMPSAVPVFVPYLARVNRS